MASCLENESLTGLCNDPVSHTEQGLRLLSRHLRPKAMSGMSMVVKGAYVSDLPPNYSF